MALASASRITAAVSVAPASAHDDRALVARVIRPTSADEAADGGVLAFVVECVGGANAQVAVRLFAETLARRYGRERELEPTRAPMSMELLVGALRTARRAVSEAGERQPTMANLTVQATVVSCHGGMAWGAQLGRLPLWLWRETGAFSLAPAATLFQKEACDLVPWAHPQRLQTGDRFVLCSQSIGGGAAVAADPEHPQITCDRIVAAATGHGAAGPCAVAMLALDDAPAPPK